MGSMIGSSFETIGPAGTTNLSTSLEIWLRPTDLTRQQVIFETGGRVDGLSFTLDNQLLRFRVKEADNFITLMYDITNAVSSGEFIQIVGTIDLNSEARLYVNTFQVAATTSPGPIDSIGDWSGPGALGVGAVNGRVGGTQGAGEGDLFGYQNFAGDIAIIRYWEDEILDQPAITTVFGSVGGGLIPVPEPGTGLLLALGLIGLCARRCVYRTWWRWWELVHEYGSGRRLPLCIPSHEVVATDFGPPSSVIRFRV
jgi:hypothetical protein